MPKFVLVRHVPSARSAALREMEREWLRWGRARSTQPSTIWHPPADVHETQTSYLIKIELAGMRDAEIEVMVDEGRLMVRGTRAEQRADDIERVHELAINYGPFQLDFVFPKAIQEDEIHARYDDGMLVIELPKRPQSQPRRITIRVDDESLTQQ